MKLRLTPTDTFFFRNHRDLETGEGSFLKGVFPPRLSTSYGALRSAYIYTHSNFADFKEKKHPDVTKWMGSPTENGQFSIKSVFIHDGHEAILPLPLDHQVVEGTDIEYEEARRLILKVDDAPSSNNRSYQLFGHVEEKSKSAVDAFLPSSEWKRALLEETDTLSVYRLSKWIINEPKTGIAIQRDTRIASDGMIYNMAFQRFKQGYERAGFIVETNKAPDFTQVTSAKFGGNGRPWHVETITTSALQFSVEEKATITKQIEKTGIARLVLLTPAIWKAGNRPANYDISSNMFTFNDITVEMLAIATQRPTVIGGWDIVKNRPKQRQHAVAAGTVVYVKVAQEDAQAFVETIFNYTWTDQLEHEGYGYVVCGASKIN